MIILASAIWPVIAAEESPNIADTSFDPKDQTGIPYQCSHWERDDQSPGHPIVRLTASVFDRKSVVDWQIFPRLRSLTIVQKGWSAVRFASGRNADSHIVSEDELSGLAKCNELKEIAFRDCNIADVTIAQLGEFCPGLELAHFSNCRSMTGNGLEPLKKLKKLKIDRCGGFDNQGVKSVGQLLELESLEIVDCPSISEPFFPALSGLLHLTTFSISSMSKNVPGSLLGVNVLQGMRELSISRKTLNENEIHQISQLPRLASLSLSYVGLPNSMWTAFRHHKQLKSVTIEGGIGAVKGISSLRTVPSLRRLSLTSQHAGMINEEDIEEITAISSLTELEILCAERISKAGFERLAGVNSLQSLVISGIVRRIKRFLRRSRI